MRQVLKELVEKTIVLEYELPHTGKAITKTVYSTDNDRCYSSLNDNDISEIIYNSIVEYAFNENELVAADFTNLHAAALQTKIRYESEHKTSVQIKYGFFGEVLLYCILCILHKANPLISKGYFYSPIENAEPKGYDSYHIVESQNQLELWFGEVKFHASYSGGVKSALEKIDTALSDKYLNRNLMALPNHIQNLNIKGSQIEQIIEDWKKNPKIKIIEQAKKYNIKLVYPVLLLFDENKSGFDESIKSAVKAINDYTPKKTFGLSVNVSIFFMLS